MKILTLLLAPLALFGQAAQNGTPIGLPIIPASLGDNSTDATATIQAALNRTTTGAVHITAAGTYRHSGLTIPDGVSLICDSVGRGQITLMYTGSGSAITGSSGTSGKFGLVGCIIDKTSLGGIGVEVTIGYAAFIQNNQFHNYTQCIYLHGSTNPGSYYVTIDNNIFETCTTGIDSNGTAGSNTVNSVTVSNNTIHHVNVGVHVCTGCSGWTLLRNDIEFPTGANGVLYQIDGTGNTLVGNWIEYNALAGATNVTGLSVAGTNNLLLGNIFGNSSGANYTSKSVGAGNIELDLYDFSAGATPIPSMYVLNGSGLTMSVQGNATVSQINSGVTIIPAVAGVALRVTGFELQAVGGNFSGCTLVELADTAGTPIVSVGVPIADLTTGTVVTPSSASLTFTTYSWQGALTADKGLQLIKTGSSCATATSLNYRVTYTINN